MRKLGWIKNCNVVLSGCSTGIGREMAILLSKKYNCKVFGIARNEQKLQSLKLELGDKFDYLTADISKKESWDVIVNTLTERDFRPDVLFNNAGVIHPFKKFRTLSDEQIEKTLSTNYLSHIYSVRAMLPLLDKSAQRAIICVSSAAAYLPCPGASIYSSSKGATLSFCEVLRTELLGEGYYVGAVVPGPVRTDLYSPHSSDSLTVQAEKPIKDKLISGYGMSAKKASRKILRKINRKKKRITIGFSSYLMDFFHRIFPSWSVAIIGRFFRIVPLVTYKDMFLDEKKKNKSI